MSGTRRPPQARDRMLGLHLRQHRQERGLSLEAAAREARVSLATMSRVESGKRHITTEDVAALLTLYRVDPVRRAELMAAARGGHRPAWWAGRAAGRAPEVFRVCATGSHAVVEYATAAVPAALQTRRYALGHLRACEVTDVADIDAAWAEREAVRAARTLTDQTYYLHESALDIGYGGAGALREQLHDLCQAADRGVGVRLVRRTAALGRLDHSWALFQYADSTPVVYVELHDGGLFLHAPVVEGYQRGAALLHDLACTAAETRAVLRDLAGRV